MLAADRILIDAPRTRAARRHLLLLRRLYEQQRAALEGVMPSYVVAQLGALDQAIDQWEHDEATIDLERSEGRRYA